MSGLISRVDVLEELTGSLGAADAGASEADLLAVLAAQLDDDHSGPRLWVVWSALRRELPTTEDILRFRRRILLQGALRALETLPDSAGETEFGPADAVRFVRDAVLIDVQETVAVNRFSGIQRVVRETVSRWVATRDAVLMGWTEDRKALRPLTPTEEARIRGGSEFRESDGEHQANEDPSGVRIVPIGGTFLMPELAADAGRAGRLAAMGEFASTRMGYIGYDCVPLTSSETADPGMASHFPLYLDAVSHADVVVPISVGALHEFEGWKGMLTGAGRPGPVLEEVFLAADSTPPAQGQEPDLAAEFGLDDTPVVLVVGTHEPRKNHLSVLHAARTLWDRGVAFQLLMIGSGSWQSEGFEAAARSLIASGYRLVIRRAINDRLLAAAYRRASVSVFTSLNEGFGLPIVESLQAGTAVIASNVGSMKEIAERYAGVITVDPRSDGALVVALGAALADPRVLEEQRSALSGNRYVTWDEYADQTWSLLVG